jgi:hypothetical protein
VIVEAVNDLLGLLSLSYTKCLKAIRLLEILIALGRFSTLLRPGIRRSAVLDMAKESTRLPRS